MKTLENKGRQHFVEMGKKGAKKRWENYKLNKQNDNKTNKKTGSTNT